MGEFYTKSELLKRWSKKLIDDYFPICSEERDNPQYRCASPMQLYDIAKVRYIESTDAFKADYAKVLKRKTAALERAERKREELIMYANGVQINIPTIEKDELIRRACKSYNRFHRPIQRPWEDYYAFRERRLYWNEASKDSNEEFLKRITINYLRHKCTCYDKELEKFFKKVGKHEAHDALQERINEAIKQKYEWLR